MARWRNAGLAQTGTLGPGPAWCWLTPAGMLACGLVRAAFSEDTITTAIGGFLDTYVFGHDRDAMLSKHLPATAADEAPDEVREALYAALDVHATYRADTNQFTIRVTITDSTPGIVAALLADPRTGGDSPNRTPAQPGEMNTADPRTGANSPSKTPALLDESNAVAIVAEVSNTYLILGLL